MPRRATLLATAAAAAVLAAAPPASAHLGRAGFTATVRAVEPATPGLHVAVLGGDDQLSVTNITNKTVTVLGGAGEPYVRFAPGGAVAVNLNAPSLYRDGGGLEAAAAPASASPAAAPRWQVVARSGTYAWHDRRIRGAAGAWTVPLRVGTHAATVRGALARAKPGGGGTNPFIFFGPVALVLAAVLFLGRRERRSSPTTAEAW
ncbi:hypothetical protein DSM104299_03960 [Baekduia alba]|uniref:hypothetical protein n=1 Tax=Baekduia alba TaxID=2997333 RepID=UPI0023402EE6|nr:hypothetical protein [Baekduia alba]WCB95217.1 hypothetical protein DSM104299_03960 [Baekduia alba]